MPLNERALARQPTYIKAWREFRGLSLQALTDKMAALGRKVDKSAINRVERGENAYTQDMLEALASALDCTVPDLLSRPPGEDGIQSLWAQIEISGKSGRAAQLLRDLLAQPPPRAK